MRNSKPLIDTRPKCEWCGYRGQAGDFTSLFVGYASGVYIGKTLQLCNYCAASYQAPPSETPPKPTIVCLCGSTRFYEAFKQANLQETLQGKIVLSIGCDFKSDEALGLSPDAKQRLDTLHLRKIDLADEILVLNVDGYLGESTLNEIKYARSSGKPIRSLKPLVTCSECGQALTPATTFEYDGLIYCPDCLPAYDAHQQW